jgi:hypothetical protein
MMANLSERDRRALRFGGFGAAAVLAFMLVVSPVLDYWDKLNREVDNADKKLRAISTSVNDASTASIKMRELRDKARIYATPSELDQQTAAMLQQIGALPAYRELSIKRVENLPLRDDEDFYRSGVSMQYAGTLTGLHRFLDQVEKAKPQLKLERVSVTANAKDSRRVEGQIVLSAYAVVTGKGAKG